MAYYKDIRDLIAALERANLLVRVNQEINKDTELHPLVRLQFRGLPESERKAFLFTKVMDVSGRHYDKLNRFLSIARRCKKWFRSETISTSRDKAWKRFLYRFQRPGSTLRPIPAPVILSPMIPKPGCATSAITAAW